MNTATITGWRCKRCERQTPSPWDRVCGMPEPTGTENIACPLEPTFGPPKASLWKRIKRALYFK